MKRRIRNTSASFQELEEEEKTSEDEEDEELQLEEDPMLRTLDPKDWKVTGLYWFLGTGVCPLCTSSKCKNNGRCLSEDDCCLFLESRPLCCPWPHQCEV